MTLAQPNASTYDTLEGTKPSATEAHEPRLIARTTRNEGLVQMMSEIGDNLFVAWGQCARCHEPVSQCRCAFGPQEPEYIGKWRKERFETSIQKRLTEEPTVEDDFDRPLPHPIRRTALAPVTTKQINSGLDDALAAVKAAADSNLTREGEDE